MLFSISLILLFGLFGGYIFQKMKFPALFGMILVGMLLGPSMFNLLDEKLLLISNELRQIALIIILTRAGLNLDLADLKKVGRPAMLLSFIPACFEILIITLIAPVLFGVTVIDALIIGSVLAAVSPAIVVPRMLNIMEEGYGTNKKIPQMIMAGASIDDIIVIILFTSFCTFAKSGDMSFIPLLRIPTSIFLGMAIGLLTGFIIGKFFSYSFVRNQVKVMILLAISFLLVTVEKYLTGWIGFSGLIAIMSIGIALRLFYKEFSVSLSSQYSKLWVGAEILLFVLVGAQVDLSYVKEVGFLAIILIICGLLFRMIGVLFCLIRTNLKRNERLFVMIAYCPKATVQAAIGSIPLSMGLACGEFVLSIAVLSILISAPFMAFCIDCSYKKLLDKEKT